MSAEEIDSYKDLLFPILKEFNPKTVLEFGSGKSTVYIGTYKSVVHFTTVEHNKKWFDKIPKQKNIHACFEDDYDKYVDHIYDKEYWDFVLVDGVNRQRILTFLHNKAHIVILHDADRPEYKDFIESYAFRLFNDSGCTVALTDIETTYERIAKCYQR